MKCDYDLPAYHLIEDTEGIDGTQRIFCTDAHRGSADVERLREEAIEACKRFLALVDPTALAVSGDAPEGLDAAWAEVEAALRNHVRTHGGGSPYLDVVQDLMAWCVASASHAVNGGGCSTEETGDTPALALRALAAALSGEKP